MKHFLLVISIIFLFSVAHAQIHAPTWKLISDQSMSSIDMLTTRSGLVGIDDNGLRILASYDDGVINGLLATGGSITSIIIRDASTAFMSVRGEGIYKSSNGWKNFALLTSSSDPYLLAVYQTNILATLGGALYISSDGVSFTPANGIKSTDIVSAAEFFSSQTVVAVTGNKLYRSLDGGKNWSIVLDGTLDRTNSIYVDRTHSSIYIGGAQCMKSLDSGKTWQTLSSIFFTLAGPVIGARDCSGNFYIAPDEKTHGPLYRSIDQGKFFQEAGPAIFSSVHLKKGVVLDRGSTIFWLDQSGLLGVVHDGIDSVITDSVRDHLIIQSDTGITNSLCPNVSAVKFGVSIFFDQCTGIILDNLDQVTQSGAFHASFVPGLLTDIAALRMAFTYRASHSGFDTAHYRLKFHSPITGNIEQKFFDVIGFGIPGSPLIHSNVQELDFSSIPIDSVKQMSVSISNPGCDVLVIDTIFSTNPAIFILAPKNFPIKLASGKTLDISVSFNPHLSGDYLESLVLQTNAGNRNITLRGTGKTISTASVSPLSENSISIYPNPANTFLTISSETILPRNISLRDLMGREVLKFKTDEVKSFLFDVHLLTDGFYVLDLGGNKFERIVIRH